MSRRYRAFARLTMACFGTLLVCAAPAVAARGEPSTAETLWKAFPLNPTGKRLEDAADRGQRPAPQSDAWQHERPFVPPITAAVEGTFVPASD